MNHEVCKRTHKHKNSHMDRVRTSRQSVSCRTIRTSQFGSVSGSPNQNLRLLLVVSSLLYRHKTNKPLNLVLCLGSANQNCCIGPNLANRTAHVAELSNIVVHLLWPFRRHSPDCCFSLPLPASGLTFGKWLKNRRGRREVGAMQPALMVLLLLYREWQAE